MDLNFDPPWVLATLLLWARIGALFLASPIFSATRVPAPFVVLFTLALSGTLALGHELRYTGAGAQGIVAFALALLAEVFIGLLLGFTIQCAAAAFAIAGQLMDVQMGLSMGAIFNPVTRSSSPVIGSTLSLFALVYFFAADAHLAVLRGIGFSVSSIPLGALWQLQSPEQLIVPVAAMFSLSVAVVAPALFALLLVELASMVAARVLPQMNVFFVAIPAKIAIGLGTLAFSVGFMAPITQRAYTNIFRYWNEVLR